MKFLLQHAKKGIYALIGSFFIFQYALAAPAANPTDPFAGAEVLPAETDDLSLIGKLAWIFGRIFLLLLFLYVCYIFISAVMHVAKVFRQANKEDDFTTFLKDTGISFAVIIVVLVLAGIAYIYGISKIMELAV